MHTQLVIIDLLYKYSYFILFPLVVVEGPVVTIIAGFLVSIGFLSFIPAYSVIVTADLVGDLMFYSVGRWWFKSLIHGFFRFLKIDLGKVNKLKSVFKNHRGKVLFFGKLSHAVGGPILVAAGLVGVPIRDFLWFNFWATLPKSLILLLVGYYFGNALGSINKYLNFAILGLVFLTAVLILIYILVVKVASNIISKFEK